VGEGEKRSWRFPARGRQTGAVPRGQARGGVGRRLRGRRLGRRGDERRGLGGPHLEVREGRGKRPVAAVGPSGPNGRLRFSFFSFLFKNINKYIFK
jgi:hypothetical protein